MQVSVLVLILSIVVILARDDGHVDIISYNVQSFPDWIQSIVYLPNQGRVEYIPEKTLEAATNLLNHQPDMICFQEAFSEDVRNQINTFAKLHNYYSLGPVPASILRFQPCNGGVMLLSKTQFTYHTIQGFPTTTTCGLDRFANKGFIYAETIINNAAIGIVATHLQAVDNHCASYTMTAEQVALLKQQQQLKNIDNFLKNEKRAVDAVFLVGDLNLNSFDGNAINLDVIRAELDLVGARLPALRAPLHGQQLRASFDFTTNTYVQKLANREHLNPPPPEHDDYVLALGGYGSSSVSMTNVIVPVKREEFGDLSDHHAVVGQAIISFTSPVSS